MTTRIALAGFVHETNTFSATLTTVDDFVANGLLVGDELRSLRGTNTVVGGAVEAADADARVELLPIIATSAIPAGLVTAEAFEHVVGAIVRGLSDRVPDAVVLDLHGAMVSGVDPDGDGEVARRVRAVVGPSIPIVAVLDLHANVSPSLAETVDALIPYRTYPHVDMADRGRQAVELAARAALGEVRLISRMVKLPLISPGQRQFSGSEPARTIQATTRRMEGRDGVLHVGVNYAFAFADVPHIGTSVVVTTDDDAGAAQSLADELAGDIWSRREQLRATLMPVEEAVHAAMAEPTGPVVLADFGDNPGGGSACDGTALLWALLDLGAEDVAFALIADPEVVAVASAAGVGASISVELGAKTDDLHGFPIPVVATVQHLSDGRFVYEGPMDTGVESTMGRTAVLRCRGRHGNAVDVIVCERRVQPYDTAILRSQGIVPEACKIIVVKSWVHFRGSFEPIASRIIEVDTPGLTSADFGRFAFRNVPRPLWPLNDQ